MHSGSPDFHVYKTRTCKSLLGLHSQTSDSFVVNLPVNMNIDKRPFYMKNELIKPSRDTRQSSSRSCQSQKDVKVSFDPWDDCHVTTRKDILVSNSSPLAHEMMPANSISDEEISLDELITLCFPRRRRHDHERFAQDLINSPTNWASMPCRSDNKKRRLDQTSKGNVSDTM